MIPSSPQESSSVQETRFNLPETCSYLLNNEKEFQRNYESFWTCLQEFQSNEHWPQQQRHAKMANLNAVSHQVLKALDFALKQCESYLKQAEGQDLITFDKYNIDLGEIKGLILKTCSKIQDLSHSILKQGGDHNGLSIVMCYHYLSYSWGIRASFAVGKQHYQYLLKQQSYAEKALQILSERVPATHRMRVALLIRVYATMKKSGEDIGKVIKMSEQIVERARAENDHAQLGWLGEFVVMIQSWKRQLEQ